MDETADAGKDKHNDEGKTVSHGEKYLGMALKTLDGKLAQQLGISGQDKGVVIVGVDKNSMAAKKGIRRGDVIVGVVGLSKSDIASVDDFRSAIDSAKKAGRDNALVRIARGKDETFVALPIGSEKEKGSKNGK